MPVVVIVLAFMTFGVIVFTVGVLKMFTRVKKDVEAAGGLEGLKAAHLRMTEEHPAAGASLVAPVGRVENTRRLWLILALSAVLLVGAGGFFQYRNIRSARLLESEGVTVRATITEKYISTDDDGDETYYLTYTFNAQSPDAGSQQVKRKERVFYELFAQVEEGGRIDVTYARSDPKVAQIVANYIPGDVSYLPIFLGGIMGLVDVLLASAAYRRFQNAVRLDAEGIPATATVLDLFATSDENSTTYYVAYTLPDGQQIRHSIRPALYKQLHVGDPIQLVYLPDNPRLFRPEWERPGWA